jgi:hypothetical protein
MNGRDTLPVPVLEHNWLSEEAEFKVLRSVKRTQSTEKILDESECVRGNYPDDLKGQRLRKKF